MDNEVMELIDQLYTMVSEAWGVPLGNESERITGGFGRQDRKSVV